MDEFDYTHPKETDEVRRCPQCGHLTDVYEAECAICGHKLTLTNLSEKPWMEPSLSIIEIDILLMIAENKSNQDIAEIMGIPENEVVSHMRGIINKLKVRTREEVAQ